MTLTLSKQLRLSSSHPSALGELRLIVWRGNAIAQQEAFAPDDVVPHFQQPATAKAIARGYSNSQAERTGWHREVLDLFAGKAETSRLMLPVEQFGQYLA